MESLQSSSGGLEVADARLSRVRRRRAEPALLARRPGLASRSQERVLPELPIRISYLRIVRFSSAGDNEFATRAAPNGDREVPDSKSRETE